MLRVNEKLDFLNGKGETKECSNMRLIKYGWMSFLNSDRFTNVTSSDAPRLATSYSVFRGQDSKMVTVRW